MNEIIGSIEITPGSQIIFSITERYGKRYGSIRKSLNTGHYAGPKKGPYLSEEAVHKVLLALKKLSDGNYQPPTEEEILCKIPLYGGRSIILKRDCFEGTKGIQLREHWDTVEFHGFGDRGVRIPIEFIDQAITLFEKMFEKL